MVMTAARVIEYLNSQKVKYTILKHATAYTAQEVAASASVPGDQLAKAVMVKLDGEMAMVVLSATCRVNFDHLKKTLKVKKAKLATEREFTKLLPDCEGGATPPFGNLYDMKVYLDEALTEQEMITFSAGSHTELIQLKSKDFVKLVKPEIFPCSYKP
jgi:Ala-tRNA(Pro) deacylase